VNGSARPLLEVGRIARAHGLRGEVVVDLVTDRHERVQPGARLVGPRGELVVAASRPFGSRWLVDFAGVTTREQAEALHGAVLSAEAIDDPDALWVHDLIGSVVVEPDGTERGHVTAVQDNPAADLLVLDGGALVPMVFVVDVSPGRVVIEPPAGLFDL
jgi:16S rRNA processing protein RimM